MPPASQHNIVEYLLRLGDDRLILGHRLSEWCGHAPILEEDIALANIALDCLGHAALLLGEAGRMEGKGRDEDTLAYWRELKDFRNCLLVEQPNGDFAFTMVRQYLVDAYNDLMFSRLTASSFIPIREIAEKVHKEVRYHCRHSGEWMLRLGDGTEESHARSQAALDDLWKYTGELFRDGGFEEELASAGIAPRPKEILEAWLERVTGHLGKATLTVPRERQYALYQGRSGRHTEALGHLLTVMQSLPRSYPSATW
jgi:ring-1,2-phenylacetyl-CoA epoxidase subunit PaaC